MPWFLIALGAPVLWAMVNIIDQYLIRKYTEKNNESVGALVLFSSLTGILFAFFIGLFVDGIFDISFFDKILLIFSGFLAVLWIILYLFAVKTEQVSAVAPWFLIVPVFTYILGYFFLGETLNLFQKIGSLIILSGVLLLSVDFSNQEKAKLKLKTIFYMVPACFLIASISIIFKYFTPIDNFWISSFWVYLGIGMTGFFIYIFIPSYRTAFREMVKKGGNKILILNLSSEALSNIGNTIMNFAFLLAPVVMVSLVGSFQPAILLFLTILCTKFFPKIANEDMSGRVLGPKIISILIIILGSLVLFFE